MFLLKALQKALLVCKFFFSYLFLFVVIDLETIFFIVCVNLETYLLDRLYLFKELLLPLL